MFVLDRNASLSRRARLRSIDEQVTVTVDRRVNSSEIDVLWQSPLAGKGTLHKRIAVSQLVVTLDCKHVTVYVDLEFLRTEMRNVKLYAELVVIVDYITSGGGKSQRVVRTTPIGRGHLVLQALHVADGIVKE